MNLTDEHAREIARRYPDVVRDGCLVERLAAMLSEAAALVRNVRDSQGRYDALAPSVMFRCHCGATMPLHDYDLHGCAHCGRRPVPKPALDFIDGAVRVQPGCDGCGSPAGSEHGTECPVVAAREVVTSETIADRVWRAHKGFMR